MLDWLDWDHYLLEWYNEVRAKFGLDVPDWDMLTFALNERKFSNMGRMEYPRNGSDQYTLELGLPYFQSIDDLAGHEACLRVMRHVFIHEMCHAVCKLKGFPQGHNQWFRWTMRHFGYAGSSTMEYEERGGQRYIPGTRVQQTTLYHHIRDKYSR